MSEESPASDDNAPQAEKFPVATVKPATQQALFLESKMWWVAIACLVLAIWLAWSSLPESGPEIVIRFPEGHGLKAGDAVRYRGIDVGTVVSVNLSETLSNVNVRVMLKPKGGKLNRDGTRFWIVRPRLSLTEVTGLETAVGAKYIGVSPGDPTGPRVDSFDGLPAPPPDELSSGGLNIVLRSDRRHGLGAGAPVMWRGVEVGQVLSVTLSPDARHVQASVRIDRSYRRLVRQNSKFWVASGFGLDVGLSGVKLSAQSLTSIARGGVSFITPDDSDNNDVSDGHVFHLAQEAEEEWLENAAQVPLIDFDLPTTVTVQYEQRTSLLGIPRSKQMSQTGVLIRTADGTDLLTAAFSPESDEESLPVLMLLTPGGAPEPLGVSKSGNAATSDGVVVRLSVDSANVVGQDAISESSLRFADRPEECLVVRTAGSAAEAISVIQAIDPEQLSSTGGVWRINHDEDLSSWHGAPVVATEDGKVIGILIVAEAGPVVAPLTDQ